MLKAVADTHAIVWYVFSDPRLSVVARQTLRDALRIKTKLVWRVSHW